MNATTQAIAAILAPRGLLATGGTPGVLPYMAEDWEAQTFTPDDVAEWVGAGIWDATTAAELRDCGISPDDLARVPVAFRYAACLGWVPIETLVAKITRR